MQQQTERCRQPRLVDDVGTGDGLDRSVRRAEDVWVGDDCEGDEDGEGGGGRSGNDEHLSWFGAFLCRCNSGKKIICGVGVFVSTFLHYKNDLMICLLVIGNPSWVCFFMPIKKIST